MANRIGVFGVGAAATIILMLSSCKSSQNGENSEILASKPTRAALVCTSLTVQNRTYNVYAGTQKSKDFEYNVSISWEKNPPSSVAALKVSNFWKCEDSAKSLEAGTVAMVAPWYRERDCASEGPNQFMSFRPPQASDALRSNTSVKMVGNLVAGGTTGPMFQDVFHCK